MRFLATAFAVFLLPGFADELPRGLGHPKPGEAHWYDKGCCDQRDCEALPDEAVSPVGEGFRVRYIASSGLSVDVTVPYSQTRLSRDGRYHGCASKVRFLCLYAHFGV